MLKIYNNHLLNRSRSSPTGNLGGLSQKFNLDKSREEEGKPQRYKMFLPNVLILLCWQFIADLVLYLYYSNINFIKQLLCIPRPQSANVLEEIVIETTENNIAVQTDTFDK